METDLIIIMLINDVINEIHKYECYPSFPIVKEMKKWTQTLEHVKTECVRKQQILIEDIIDRSVQKAIQALWNAPIPTTPSCEGSIISMMNKTKKSNKGLSPYHTDGLCENEIINAVVDSEKYGESPLKKIYANIAIEDEIKKASIDLVTKRAAEPSALEEFLGVKPNIVVDGEPKP